MKNLASAPADERATIFLEAANRMGIGSHIVEKDFWVCWLLKVIFTDPNLGGHLIFKGGTSLSKVFNIIQRFSEDIDLSVDPEWLGFKGGRRLDAAASRSQFEKRSKALQEECCRAVREEFLPPLKNKISTLLPNAGENALYYEDDEFTHSPLILFNYPRRAGKTGSLRPQVKLEFGALYDQRPNGTHKITPLLADVLPNLLNDASCSVTALEAERTFWEKATILHAEFHRPKEKESPPGISRHYYDLYFLSEHAAGKAALPDTALLTRVREHKQAYFRSGWASYETAVPGSFRLAPPSERLPMLDRDYRNMSDMFLTQPPTFKEIIAGLIVIEERFNSIGR